MAWTFISTAAELCQTLGYHRLRLPRENDQPLRASQERLFWIVYKVEKALALRLGRSSHIRDTEITLPFDPEEPRSTKLARIQGKVYDQLYSPVGLSRLDDERGYMAEALARELRDLIDQTRVEILVRAHVFPHPELANNICQNATSHVSEGESDPMQAIYLRCDLVSQCSLLALILRAIPTARGSLSGVSDDCVAVARNALDIHQQCMTIVRDCKSDPFIVTKYINW